MKQTVRFGAVLLIFGAIAGGVLAFSNSVTAPIIAERAKEESFGAYAELMTEADDFAPIAEEKLAEIMAENTFVLEVFEAKKGEEIIGYAFRTKSAGYGGDLITVSGFNIDGTISGIKVLDNSETPGLGTKVVDDPAYAASYVGKSSASDLVLAPAPSADNEIQALSGATISASGVMAGVNGARKAYLNFFTDTPVVEEKEDDRGFGPNGLVFKEADEFVALDPAKLDEILANNRFVKEVYEAKQAGELVGYSFWTISGGYGGEIKTVTGIGLDATITEIRIVEQTETPGLGTRIVDDPAFQESFVGKDVSNGLVHSASAAGDNEILLLSGATVTTDGVLYGVNGSIDAFVNYLFD